MQIRKMDEAVTVRCDKDKTVMEKVRVSYPDTGLEGPAFKCTEPDCTRFFTDGRGYIDVIDGAVLAEKFQQRCLTCKTPMFLSKVEQGEEIWRCPNTSVCGREQRMAS